MSIRNPASSATSQKWVSSPSQSPVRYPTFSYSPTFVTTIRIPFVLGIARLLPSTSPAIRFDPPGKRPQTASLRGFRHPERYWAWPTATDEHAIETLAAVSAFGVLTEMHKGTVHRRFCATSEQPVRRRRA